MKISDAKIGQPYIDSWDDLVLFVSKNANGVEMLEINGNGRISIRTIGKWYFNSVKKFILVERGKFIQAIFEAKK